MSTKKPDQIVHNTKEGYNASKLPYATTVGAPIIKIDDIVSWKSRGITSVNKEFENKFNELKTQYESLMQEYQWNEIIYNAKYAFEPIIGEIYHLYIDTNGENILSLIAPNEWNKEHLGTFKMNSDKKWIHLK